MAGKRLTDMLRIGATLLLLTLTAAAPIAAQSEECLPGQDAETAALAADATCPTAATDGVTVAGSLPPAETADAADQTALASPPATQGEAGDPAADQIAVGERIYQKTAGGVGCQYCHGVDARGFVGPNIRGKSPAAIKQALGIVLQMGFISNVTPLTEADIDALSAYLKSLEAKP